jgi:hypothetical protein
MKWVVPSGNMDSRINFPARTTQLQTREIIFTSTEQCNADLPGFVVKTNGIMTSVRSQWRLCFVIQYSIYSFQIGLLETAEY